MSEIQRTGKWNPGGGRWLELLPTAGVATYTARGFQSPTLTLRTGFSWTRVYCTSGTLRFRQDEAQTDNGRTYTHEIRGFSPDDSQSKATALHELLRYERVMARFCDNTGLIRLIGSPTENLTLVASLDTDADVPGERGYSLTVKGITTTPATYV